MARTQLGDPNAVTLQKRNTSEELNRDFETYMKYQTITGERTYQGDDYKKAIEKTYRDEH